jgi:hypothetical protein
MRRRSVLAALTALCLLAAACGDDGGEPAAPTTTAAGTTTTSAAEPDDATTTTEPVELTASFQGVTPETIKVGILTYDFDGLAALGVNFGLSNSGDLYLAAIESVNDRGGVHGRMLEPVLKEFLPVQGTAPVDAVCVELTEDEMVFVVIGTSLQEQILCFTELHETAAIVAAGITEERMARARAPYAAVLDTSEGRAAHFAEIMAATGVFDDATVGVTGAVDVSLTGYESVLEALRGIGLEPIEGLIGGNADDLSASAREQALIYQRMDDAGVDVTVSTSGVPLTLANAIDAGYESPQWVLSTAMSGRGLTDAGVPHEYLAGALAVMNTPIGTPGQPDMADDPLVAGCVDDLVARSGHEVFYTLDAEVNDLSQALSACANVAILEQALLNAGPVLTNDSLQAGLEAIGPIDLPGYTDASLGPDDMGAIKGLTLVEFDATTGLWNLVDG